MYSIMPGVAINSLRERCRTLARDIGSVAINSGVPVQRLQTSTSRHAEKRHQFFGRLTTENKKKQRRANTSYVQHIFQTGQKKKENKHKQKESRHGQDMQRW